MNFYILNFIHSLRNKNKQQNSLSFILYFILNIFNYFFYFFTILNIFTLYCFKIFIEEELNQNQIYAFKQAKQGIIPDEQYQFDPNIKDKDNNTVCYYLWNNGVQVPDNWQDEQYKNPQRFNFNYILFNYHDITNAMKDAIQGIIPDKKYYHDPTLIDDYKWTVAMYLAFNGIIPPKQWQHNKYIRDYFGKTVQTILQEKHIQVPEYWQYPCEYDDIGTPAIQQAMIGQIPNKENYHEPWISNKDGETVAYLLIINGIEVPNEWLYDSSKLICGQTTAMKLAEHGIIPPKEWIHDPNIKDKWGNTVADFLKRQYFPISNEWYNENMKNKQRNPHFIEQSIYGIIPDKSDNVNSDYQNCDGFTVAMCLTLNEKEILKQWKHDSSIQNNYGNTIAMLLAKNGKDIPKEWQHKPQLQNNYGNTVALLLAHNGIIPSSQWYHNPFIKNKDTKTVEDYLLKNKKEIPEQWRIKDDYDNPQQNKYGRTKAIIIAEQGKIPYKEYEHKPEIQDNDGYTVAMYLADQCIIPPDEWQHDKSLRNMYGQTVQIILHNNDLTIPDKWKYPSTFDKNDNSPAMLQAIKGIILSNNNHHDPKQSNKYGDTVAIMLIKNKIQVPDEWLYEPEYKINNDKTTAMKLAECGIEIPKYWEHDKLLTDNYGNTVAMHYAYRNHNIPEQWRHDKLLTNKYGDTIAIIYSSKGIIPDDYWMHDIDIKNKWKDSIRSNLLKYNYIYQNNQFILNVQTEVKQEQCHICLNDEEQEFIKTTCNHNVCLQCFKELVKNKQQNKCPECRRLDWIIPINDNQYQQYLKQINRYYY